MYKYEYIALYVGIFLLFMTGCEKIAGDGYLPGELDEALENTGATIEVGEIRPVDVNDIEDIRQWIIIYIYDYKGGDNIDGVEIYLNAMDLYGGELNMDLSDDPLKLFEIPMDHLDPFKDGLVGRVPITINELFNNFPVEISKEKLETEDLFEIQWQIKLKSGITVTEKCQKKSDKKRIEQSFCSEIQFFEGLQDDKFIGNYRFTQLDPSSLSDIGIDAVYDSMQFVSELTLGGTSEISSVRVFEAIYLGSNGFELKSEQPILFTVRSYQEENKVTFGSTKRTGYQCEGGPGLSLGPEEVHLSSFDKEDDSEFILAITDNVLGDCAAEPKQVRFLVEKL